MKKLLSTVLAILCLLPFFGAVPTRAKGLSLSAKSAVLIDAQSRQVLFQKNAFVRLPMASTTKIMTALVAIEQGNLDRIVKTDKRARRAEGSSLYLAEDERITMRDLLYGLLLASANDAAEAIAYEISGSIEGFAQLMNQKAYELGLRSTNFTNPHGLHDENHYTTAYDLSLITAAALENKEFAEICATQKAAIPININEGTRYISNHNKLLRLYSGCIGVKTGFTKKSGRCLVSAAERDGLTLIAVTLDAPNDWSDHKALLDYGFGNYQRAVLADEGGFSVSLDVIGGGSATAVNSEKLSALLPINHKDVEYKTEVLRPLFAPIEKSSVVGKVICYLDGKKIAESPLIITQNIETTNYKRGFFSRLKRLIGL